MLDNYLISLSICLLIIFIIFKIVLGPMTGPQLLKQSKLHCTVYWIIIVSSLSIFIRIVCWIIVSFHFQYDFG